MKYEVTERITKGVVKTKQSLVTGAVIILNCIT